VDIQISPEQINEYLVKTILESSIGTAIKKIIDDEVAKLSRAYDNPLQKVVEVEMARQIQVMIQTDYTELLKQKIREHLTEEALSNISSAAWDTLYEKIQESRKERWR